MPINELQVPLIRAQKYNEKGLKPMDLNTPSLVDEIEERYEEGEIWAVVADLLGFLLKGKLRTQVRKDLREIWEKC